MTHEIEILERDQTTPSTKMDTPSGKPKVGDWFWVQDDEDAKKSHLGCAVHVGTNYVKIEGVGNWEDRVHFKDFHALCKLEPNPNEHITKKANYYRREIDRLTTEVRELTSSLGLTPSALPEGESAVAALAVRNNDDAVGEYKSALVLAKDKTLPALFEDIKKASSGLSRWL